MLRLRYSTLSLCALALIFGASAHAQGVITPAPTSWSPSYAKGSGTATTTSVSTTIASGGPVTYTVGSTPALPGWLQVACGGTITDSSSSDTCTFTVVTAVADHMLAGNYNFTVNFQISGVTDSSVPVALTITSATSPLSSSPSSISLTYVLHGVSNQTAAKGTSTISGNDTIADTYAITSGYSNWLTVTATNSKAGVNLQDTLSFNIVQSNANALSGSSATTTVHLTVPNQPDLTIAVTVTLIAAQPLTTTTTSLPFTFTIGATSAPAAQTAAIVAPSSMGYTVDPATVPAWLAVSPATGTAATTPGTTVTFTPSLTVLKGLAAGNYSGSVGFAAALTGSGNELLIPVVLTVSNPTATVSLKAPTANTTILGMPGAVQPAPVITMVSSNEPTGFTAVCTVTTTDTTYVQSANTCKLSNGTTSGSTMTGIAYTFGTPLTTQFDAALFTSKLGTVIVQTVTVTAGSQSAVTETNTYTLQPIDPTFTGVSPTSVAVIPSNSSILITLTGTNFVGPGMINSASSLSPTKVFVGSTDMTANAVVYSPTSMAVSVPAANFPALGTSKSVNMTIGLANQTASAAPTTAKVTQTVAVTTNPVIYAITSTATYNQPAPGGHPSLAPYEIVSIFGANFGPTTGINGTVDSFGRFGNTVAVSGSGSSAVNLSVSFKVGSTAIPAPIIFANGTQINCIVPSGVTVPTGTATVTVTSGTASSDGLFTVNTVLADPGIFTLSSEGVGQGAIVNQDYSVNKAGNETTAGQWVSIYMTGLGAPNSTATDNSANTGGYAAGCVAVSNTGTNTPGYLQVVNTKVGTTYTPPTPAWTNIDGAVINPARLAGASLAPCFLQASGGATNVSVVFGSGGSAVTASGAGQVLYAGFAPGQVTGLYQINVIVPTGVSTGAAVPVQVVLGTEGHSPASVVTMAIK